MNINGDGISSINDAELFAKKIVKLIKENQQLRKYIWLNHGCEITSLYGDDGQMQCGKCMIDFKNWDVDIIIKNLLKKREI